MTTHASTNAITTTSSGGRRAAPCAAPRAAPRTASARSRRRWLALALAVLVLIAAPAGALAAPAAQEGDGWTGDGSPGEYGSSEDYGWTEDHGWSAGYRWIDIDLSNQWLTAYEGDTPVFGAAVSTGIDGLYTPTGDYAILWMLDWETMVGEDYYLPDVPYVMYFADHLAIHGTYWHDSFGYPMSHGCVNLPISEAGWLYDWASIGTPVTIHY